MRTDRNCASEQRARKKKVHTCVHTSGVSTRAHTRTCTHISAHAAHARTSILHTRIQSHIHAHTRTCMRKHAHIVVTHKAGQGRAGQGRPGQGKPRQGKTRQPKAISKNGNQRESRNRATTRPHQSYAVHQRATGDTNKTLKYCFRLRKLSRRPKDFNKSWLLPGVCKCSGGALETPPLLPPPSPASSSSAKPRASPDLRASFMAPSSASRTDRHPDYLHFCSD